MREIILTLVCGIALLGCSSSDELPIVSPAEVSIKKESVFSLKINGNLVSTKDVSASLSMSSVSNQKKFEIVAKDSKYKFEFSITDNNTDEKFNKFMYPFGYSNNGNQGLFFVNYYYNEKNTVGEHMIVGANIYVTEHDVENNTISGTFTAELKKNSNVGNLVQPPSPEKIIITEGKFISISYKQN